MSTNERLISLEGLATIRENLTQDLAVPLLKQRMNPAVLPTALALLHELDLAESRENVLKLHLKLAESKFDSLNQDYEEAEKDLEGADQAIVDLIEIFEDEQVLPALRHAPHAGRGAPGQERRTRDHGGGGASSGYRLGERHVCQNRLFCAAAPSRTATTIVRLDLFALAPGDGLHPLALVTDTDGSPCRRGTPLAEHANFAYSAGPFAASSSRCTR